MPVTKIRVPAPAPYQTLPSFFFVFLGLSRFFRDFPDLSGDGPGIFPIRPFSLSRPIKSTYEEQSRKGPRHNLDLTRKKWETPRFGTPGLASQRPGRSKNTTTHYFTIAVLIHSLCKSPAIFALENKVFQRPSRIVLLPSYFFATTVVN